MRFGFHDNFPEGANTDRIGMMFGGTQRHMMVNTMPWIDVLLGKFRAAGQGVIALMYPAHRNLSDWGTFVFEYAQKYRGKGIVAMELLNEPNLDQFGGYTPTQASSYISVGTARAREGGWVGPILAGGPARVGDWEEYLRSMFKEGVPKQCHLAIHPYPKKNKPVVDSIEYQIDASRKILKNRSGHGKIWVTETGISTAMYTEGEQAQHLCHIYRMAKRKRLEGLTIFRFQDGPSWESGTDLYERMGVVELDGTKRPAYDLLKKLHEGS